jgi:Nucleotidyltransferase of unknown function (DUF6036)
MRPDRNARREYVAAFGEIAARIVASLSHVPKRALPIKMYVAGGAALHLYTGERISLDIDAAFSHRIALPENLEVAYRDADGVARLLYVDRNFNDSVALMHEDARDDSQRLDIDGIDPKVLEVRLLAPLDLAVSKLGRFSSQDRDDIASLAKRKLIESKKLRQRAEECLAGYVGDTARVQGAIDIACRVVTDIERTRAL